MYKKLLLLSLPLFSSCMTYDPYTGEQQVAKTTTGSIIGGLAGAALGNQVKGNRKTRDQAMIAGALFGAAAGGAIGNKMDKQEANLRRRLQNTGVSVTRQGNQILLRMPSNITFESSSSEIRDDFMEVLDSIALICREYKNNIEVAGHTDSVGSVATNQILSQQRADSVASYLRQKGIDGARIHAVGYGKSRPISSLDSENRRVEITLSQQ